jgi:hypothetical protein
MNAHQLSDNGGRRLGIDRRQFKYAAYMPEQRSDKKRRSGQDRRQKPRPYNKLMK